MTFRFVETYLKKKGYHLMDLKTQNAEICRYRLIVTHLISLKNEELYCKWCFAKVIKCRVIWMSEMQCFENKKGFTHVRLNGQNFKFYLETHSTSNNICFIQLRNLIRNSIYINTNLAALYATPLYFIIDKINLIASVYHWS